MKIYYHPSYTACAYVNYAKHDKSMLFDTACVSTAGLLEQLLLRAGLPQGVAEDSEQRTQAREDAYLSVMSADWIERAKDVDPEGTVKQVLLWRDCLLMEDWTPELCGEGTSPKLKSLSEWEQAYQKMMVPARADRWREVLQYISAKGSMLKEGDEIHVMTPKVLLPQLVVKVLELLKAEFEMESPHTELKHPDKITVVTTDEQYEAWQQVHNYADKADVFVCADTERLNNTMFGIGGAEWQTTNAGCPKAITQLTDMLDAPERLVWLDCAGNQSARYRFDWLTQAEKEDLAKASITLPAAEELSSAMLHEQFTLLNRIDEVTLICPKMHEGELLGEHPIVTTLQRKKEQRLHTTPLPKTEEGTISRFEPQETYQLNVQAIQRLKMGNISPTALENLLQLPFDFLLEKMAQLPAPEDNEDENVELAKGSVAHKVVELMMEECKANLSQMEQMLEKAYADLFDKALHATDRFGKKIGQPLTQDENRNELATFKMDLRESIQNLLTIIHALNLTPVECEHEFVFEDGLDEFKPAKGSIDMILKNELGQYVVFDFKYSKSSFYPDKLKLNHSTQLEFYRKALEKEGKTVAWTAYYLFPKQTLYTKADLAKTDNVSKVGKPRDTGQVLEDLWLAMRKGYQVRMEQMASGLIEEAEGLDVDGLQYTLSDDVFPLQIAYNGKTEKAGGFCRYKTKSTNLLQKPTHHTILKNHLK